MHQQIRVVGAKSPPDLEAVLQVLADAGINIIAVGGSNLEHGGELGFATEHEDQQKALDALTTAGYRPRVADVLVCWLTNEPGSLLDCIRQAAESNRGTGKGIRDLAIGVPGPDGRIPVQVYSDRRP